MDVNPANPSKTEAEITDFLVAFGLQCTMSCAHCCNNSGPSQSNRSAPDEIQKISELINRANPQSLVLAGGEPTLFIEETNLLLSLLECKPEIVLTTNGWFANSAKEIEETLGSLQRLDYVQLSFDRFHGRKIGDPQPRLLAEYCKNRSVKFACIACLSCIDDLVFAADIERAYGCFVAVQKIDGSGRAKSTGVEFKYPFFDPAVLDKTCQNASTLSYIHGRGLTVCCGSITTNLPNLPIFAQTIEDLMALPLFKEVTTKTMRQRIEESGISEGELLARMSSPCNLCEHLMLTRMII